MTAPSSTRMVRGPRRSTSPRYRLVCLHHAGAGAAAFSSWWSLVPSDVEFCVPRLPGRETRLGERPAANPDEAVADVLETIGQLAQDTVPLAIYGHSMGGVLAYELCRALTAEGAPSPLFLAIGAASAPRHHVGRPPWLPAGYDRTTLVGLMRDYAGTRSEVLEHTELLDLLLPAFEADLALVDAYRPALPPDPVACPLVTFWGEDDPLVTQDEVRTWEECAAGEHDHRVLDGDHFLVESHGAGMLAHLDAWSHHGDWAARP